MHFLKMHGLGNDFAVFDARNAPFPMDAARARAIAGRKTGIGCDQVIVMEASARAEAFMRIYNADGSEVGACGNASRCVADILLREKAADCVRIETLAGMLGVPAGGWRPHHRGYGTGPPGLAGHSA